MKPEALTVEIEQRELDYLPEVAQKIAIKLSFGYDDVDTWNVYGAPTAEQQKAFLADYLNDNELHPRQIAEIKKWMSREATCR